MRSKYLIIGLLFFLLTKSPVLAQKFSYTYNGVTITYEITSVPNHEVKVHYVPEYVTEVTVPAVVHFNGEAFRVTEIGGGGSRGGGLFSSYERDGYYSFEKCKMLKSVILPNTIKKIGTGAFTDCTWLRSIKLPSGLEMLGAWAFHGCVSLTSIALPSSLKKIECNAFDGCINLNLASIKIPASIKTLEGNVFREGTLFSGKGAIFIPATIDTIEYHALAGCDFRLSEQLGVLINDTVVINTGNFEVKYDDFWKGFPMSFGKKFINREAFGNKYRVIGLDIFKGKAVSAPNYYLRTTFGKPAASYVKKILIAAGKYNEVLAYYPNDAEVKELWRKAECKRLLVLANNKRDKGNYTEAKRIYEKVLAISPNDKATQAQIAQMDEAIVDQERQRKAAEEKARREAEEAQVRAIVDQKAKLAIEDIGQGCLQIAANKLKHALDTAKAHNYEYRKAELTLLIDSIHHIQAQIADKSKVFEYKTFRPDLYEITNRVLGLKINNYLKDRDKPMRNHITLTMNTDNQLNSFQLAESSRPLRKFCSEELVSERLMPLIIDSQSLNARATYNYDIEYAKGTAKVWFGDNKMKVYSKYGMSPQLESDLKRVFHSKIGALPSSCKGTYKFTVTSMNVGGQMGHAIKLKSMHVQNGPQNAWRSLLVPGWGDKYVDEDGRFDRWKPIFSYGLVGLGVLFLKTTTSYTTTESGWVCDSTWVDVSDDPFYVSQGRTGWWVTSNYRYETHEIEHEKKYTGLGIACAIIGGAIWVGDVVHVWFKGTKNKRYAEGQLGRLSFAYNPTYNAPELVYSLRF